MGERFSRQLQRTFIAGLIVLAPLFATVWILVKLYEYLKSISPFGFRFGTVVTFMLVVGFILLVGLLSRTALGSFLNLVEDWVIRLPGVGLLYRSVRELVNAISGEQRRFRQPVWVKPIPGSPLRLIGFVTREELANLGARGHVAVYLPDSYNISGKLVVLPRKAVRPLRTENDDLLAFVATGGLTGAQSKSGGLFSPDGKS
jgi:uncharacterized membrane protein